jgi:hypothetical protein
MVADMNAWLNHVALTHPSDTKSFAIVCWKDIPETTNRVMVNLQHAGSVIDEWK